MNEIINHEFMCQVIATEDAAHIWDIFCVHVVLLMCVCVCDSNLVVRRGKPEEVVADLIKRLGSVSTVAFHEEVVPTSPPSPQMIASQLRLLMLFRVLTSRSR